MTRSRTAHNFEALADRGYDRLLLVDGCLQGNAQRARQKVEAMMTAQEYYTYMGGSLGGNRHFTSVLPRLWQLGLPKRPKGCIWYRLRPRTYSTPT